MDTAARVLVVGGVLNLAFGFVTGFVLGRLRETRPEAPKYLMLAHTGPLMMGPILLSLVLALGLSRLPARLETLAALLLVVGSAVQAIGNTVNWRSGTVDEFVEHGAGYYLAASAGFLLTLGLALIVAGVLNGVRY